MGTINQIKSKLKNYSFVKNNLIYYRIIKNKLSHYRDRLFVCISPKYLSNHTYKKAFHKDINWESPTNLIEKIYWLQLNTDTSLWTLCADKYRVREFVKERGCEETLNKLYGVWENADEINFDSLPNSFVLKTNNSCGQIILVKDKKELNIAEAKKKLKSWMKTKYGYNGAQLHYTRIKPCIIAEELLVNDNNENSSLVDYKIWCFNGKAEFILVVSDRGWNEHGCSHYSLSTYDLNWNNTSTKTLKTDDLHYSGYDIPKPHCLKEMIEYAQKLSAGFPEVRVDFYEINKKVIFGELTFTTGYGYFTEEYYDYLGSKTDIKAFLNKTI